MGKGVGRGEGEIKEKGRKELWRSEEKMTAGDLEIDLKNLEEEQRMKSWISLIAAPLMDVFFPKLSMTHCSARLIKSSH